MDCINKYDESGWWILGEYYCDLTKFLDDVYLGERCDNQKHYILARDYEICHELFPIRIPGFTCGAVMINKDNAITKIQIGSHCLKLYPENINEILNERFVREKIILV